MIPLYLTHSVCRQDPARGTCRIHSHFSQLAGVEFQSPLQEIGQAWAVSDDDEHHRPGLRQLHQHPPDLIGRAAVEVAGRLIGQKQVRGIDQRAGQGGPLPRAAEESAGRWSRRSASPTRSSSISARWMVSSGRRPRGTAGSSTFSTSEHCGSR